MTKINTQQLNSVKDFWQKYSEEELTLSDAKEIIENTNALIKLLSSWVEKEENKEENK